MDTYTIGRGVRRGLDVVFCLDDNCECGIFYSYSAPLQISLTQRWDD